jgi:cell division septum initiation protein DivIVA
MGGNSVGTKPKSTDTVELWGRRFKITKDGLDKEQVVSFVNELIAERDMLSKQQEHLSSLTRLAEKTVTAADELAKQVHQEAAEQAKAEANAIAAKAEEQAQQIIEEKRAEAVAMANTEAEAIKAKAQQQAELLLGETARKIQPELRYMAQRLHRELLSQLENLKQQVVAFETEFEHKLSQLSEEAGIGARERDKTGDEFQELIRATDQTNTGEPEWELQILPPLDIMQTLAIVTHLDNLPEVQNTELIPQVDRASIMVFLREPIQLIDTLRALPQVAEVREDKASADSKPRKVQIVLAGKTAPQPADHSHPF